MSFVRLSGFRLTANSNLRRNYLFSRNFHQSTTLNSGHNKWSTIKHDKAKKDADKNKIANKFSNAIAVAAREGGPDPTKNIRLQTTIEAALKANVVKKVIENAIKRGAGIGTEGKKQLETMTYEGVGPSGVAFVVEALTDKKTRTISDVRSVFNKFGGSITPSSFNFDRKGYVVCELPEKFNEEEVFDKVLEVGGEDYEIIDQEESSSKLLEVSTDPTETGKVASNLKDLFKVKEVGIGYIPKEDLVIKVKDEEVETKLNKMILTLEDLDDVTDIYHNWEVK